MPDSRFCLFELAADALAADSPAAKLAAVAELERELAHQYAVLPAPTFVRPAGALTLLRGHYQRVPRVLPGDVKKRNPGSREGRASLLHAIAHIEYSAIDLALDHALRFDGFPADYYYDWLQVAIDEARHFKLLCAHLQTLDHDYGDFPVHDGLWDMAEKTAHDALARMAMVPRLLEARGLDATPPIQRKLAAAGDHEAVRLLDIILHDEEGHVRLGDRWFRELCAQHGLEPEATFRRLIAEYAGPWPQTPMNEASRLQCGFSRHELDELTAQRPTR